MLLGAIACIGVPHDLPAVIDAHGIAPRAVKCTQVSHRAVTVEKGVLLAAACIGVPTTCPLALMPLAPLYKPPNVPKSVIVPLL